MKILVTGGTGFIGEEVVKKLKENLDYQIFCISRNPEIYSSENNVFYIDYCNALQLENCDLLLHIATNYGRKNSEDLIWTNIEFPASLIDRISFKYVINFDTFFTRNSCYKYLNEYTESKIKFKVWLNNRGVAYCNLVLFHVYGISRPESGKFFDFVFFNLMEGRQIDLTKGENNRDFISLNMTAEMIAEIVNKRLYFKYKEMEIGSGSNLSVREFVLFLKKSLNSSSQLNFGALPMRENELNIPPAKVVPELNYILSKHSLQDEINRIIRTYESNK